MQLILVLGKQIQVLFFMEIIKWRNYHRILVFSEISFKRMPLPRLLDEPPHYKLVAKPIWHPHIINKFYVVLQRLICRMILCSISMFKISDNEYFQVVRLLLMLTDSQHKTPSRACIIPKQWRWVWPLTFSWYLIRATTQLSYICVCVKGKLIIFTVQSMRKEQ